MVAPRAGLFARVAASIERVLLARVWRGGAFKFESGLTLGRRPRGLEVPGAELEAGLADIGGLPLVGMTLPAKRMPSALALGVTVPVLTACSTLSVGRCDAYDVLKDGTMSAEAGGYNAAAASPCTVPRTPRAAASRRCRRVAAAGPLPRSVSCDDATKGASTLPPAPNCAVASAALGMPVRKPKGVRAKGVEVRSGRAAAVSGSGGRSRMSRSASESNKSQPAEPSSCQWLSSAAISGSGTEVELPVGEKNGASDVGLPLSRAASREISPLAAAETRLLRRRVEVTGLGAWAWLAWVELSGVADACPTKDAC